MGIFQIILICVLGVGVCFLLFFIIKSLVIPKKIDSIQKLLKKNGSRNQSRQSDNCKRRTRL